MIAEKSLKAVIAYNTGRIPPKIHDLPRLASLGGIWEELSSAQKELIKTLTPLQIEARYPEYKEKLASTLTTEYCSKVIEETEDFLCWIKKRLEK